MADSRYRLAKHDEIHLHGNANNGEVRIMRGSDQQSRRHCNTSVLAFLIVFLVLTCIALIAFLAIEKMRNYNRLNPSLVQNCSSHIGENGKQQRGFCTTSQCILAASCE